jgi:predicted ATPase
LETIATSPAVQLFVARARAAAPDFGLEESSARGVAGICRRLDGLPLAIELASARTGLLGPEPLLRRLEQRVAGPLALLTTGAQDLPERQQTLRATLAWSHDLLEPTPQVLFRRLAVFAGGWTLESASEVCADAGLAATEVLDCLQALVDSSLIQVRRLDAAAGETRFGLLETVREYALEQLDTAGEGDQLRGRHAGYFLALAENSEPHLRGRDQRIWFDRLDAEFDNLRAALAWATHDRSPGTGAEPGNRARGFLRGTRSRARGHRVAGSLAARAGREQRGATPVIAAGARARHHRLAGVPAG